MLCTMPSNSELRTKLISAARGLLDTCPYSDIELTTLELDERANLLFELLSSQRSGSGACFFAAWAIGFKT